MSWEEVLITHDGYTDTAYSTCGHTRCTTAVLAAVGVDVLNLAPEDVDEVMVADHVYVTCTRLGETDSDEWCAACGDFLRHGLNCECPDAETDRESLGRPHIDLAAHPAITELW